MKIGKWVVGEKYLKVSHQCYFVKVTDAMMLQMMARCAAIFSGKIGHSERSEESRPRREENEILRCAQRM